MKKIFFVLFVFSQFLTYPQIKWEPINSPKGGKVTYLEVSNNGTYFVGLPGYIYVSSDGGKNWEQTITNGGYFSQIKADKDGNVFAVDNDSQPLVFIYEPSTKKWKKINKGIGPVGARHIAISPNGDLYLSTTGGVYKSTDKGSNWTLSGLSGKFVRGIAVNENGNIFAGVDYEGIYKSTDNGATWFKSGNIPINHYPLIYIDDYGTIFTVLYYPLEIYPMGIYRSTDDGNTWEKKDSGIIYPNISSIISIGPGTLVCAGPKSIFYRTTNNGDTWEVTTQLPTASPISSISKLPDNSILASSNGLGLIRSIDEGKSFQISNDNFMPMGIRALVAFNNNEIIAISIHDVFKSTDGGLNWNVSSTGLPYSDKTNLFRTQSGKLYVSTIGSGIYQSVDNGVSWEPMNIDTSGALSMPIFQKENGEIFAKAVGRDGLVKSTDGGNTWTYIKAVFYNAVSAIASGPVNDIYVSSLGTFLKSTDDGNSWQIKKHLSLYTTAMKTFGDYVFVTSQNGVLSTSEDKGETWTEKNVANRSIKDLTITKDGTLLIAVQETGIMMSVDKGQTWTMENSGITDLNVKSFYNDGNDKIYLCTGNDLSYGSGIYLLNLKTTGINSNNKIPDNYYLGQNYPNPFNPSTTINYSLKESGDVLIKVFDMLGREVAILKNEYEKAGNHIVNFNANDLPSGIYFYRISAGHFNQTKKMVLIR